MKTKLFIIITILLLPLASFANLNLITWKGIYYHAVPIKKGVTFEYCKAHTPGVFIHSIKNNSAINDKGIKVDHSSFNIDKVGGVYLIYGDFLATGKYKNIPWQDHIYYYVYKFTEAGVTQGIWYSNECKGLYKGIAINNKNSHKQKS